MRDARDTKDQILDAAERLFAAEGFGATSLRRILGDVGLNPAAIHYHFGGKDEMVEALFERRLGPLNAERMRRFDALETRAGAAPTVASIVDAFISPALAPAARGEEGERFLRFVGRYLQESGEAASARLRRTFEPVIRRFVDLLARALPELRGEALAWRVHFLVGAMFHSMTCREHVSWLCGGVPSVSLERAREELIAFASAGLSAPALHAAELRS
ncbi:MAG: CerR family C-terminal domain-containing protein [Planctomycetes bacterium]|nr:CerR family C-terminal domain-containing protein [Planctomycetota bacterium]